MKVSPVLDGGSGLKHAKDEGDLVPGSFSRPRRREWIETIKKPPALPRLGFSRPRRREWIETIALRLIPAASTVSPVLDGGSGLKPATPYRYRFPVRFLPS